jgi:GGDEF domain-containing protein
MTDRFQLGAAVRSRSWDWLFALRKRLNVELQLVDDGQSPLLTASGSGVDALLGEETPGVPGASATTGVRLAVSTAIRTRTPQSAAADRLQTVIVPVTLDRVVSGALVVARRTSPEQPLESVRSQLELVGFWLTNAIEAHLQSPPAAQNDLDRVSALCRLLADDSASRSDRDIVSTFIESLAVWHDLEACAYVETDGEYVREVSLPGVDPTHTPAAIPRTALPDLDDVTRLARSDFDRLGFFAASEVVLTHLGSGPGSWLVAMTGSIEADELQRLSLYATLLDQALARAAQTTMADVLATVSRLLLADAGNPEEQARQAVRHLQTALAMTRAALTATTRTGAPLLHVGPAFSAADLAAGSGAGKVVIIRRDPQQYAMALVAEWPADHRVTQRENDVVETVAGLLESWVRRLVRQSVHTGDRRASSRGFDEALERFARDAVQGGIPVTAVVIQFADAAFRPDVTQTRVARLREHLRGTDLVGRLSAGDVGLLLQDTAAAQAEVLMVRVLRLLEREGVPPGQLSIGMATRRPGDPVTGALAEEARQRARYHASDH